MLRAGHGLILIVIMLLTTGVVMVTSAGLSVGQESSIVLRDVLLGRTTWLAVLAMVFLLIGSRIPVQRFFFDTERLRSPIPWIILLMLGLLILVHIPGIGHEVNGARRWIKLGPIGFQPSEFAKWGLVIALAWHVARRASVMDDFLNGFLPPMVLVLFVCALIATEDLGTAVLIGCVGICMVVAGGSRIRHAALLMPVAALGFIAAVLSSPYRLDRVRAFVDPYQDPQGIGYHVLQSMAAINSGGLAGRGLGNSIHKFGYLPEDTTDFIFAIISEELGIVGAGIVILLYIALIALGLSIIMRVSHPFSRLLGIGILFTIALQTLINIAVVTGSAPTKGIALPLLSSGGTGWVLTAFCIGLIVSLDREHSAMEEVAPETRVQTEPELVTMSPT